MMRRFVNVMAEKCKTGMSPLHRLDISKHPLPSSRAEAKAVEQGGVDPRPGGEGKIRRFVNVVAEDFKTGLYSLHRLDVSNHLFHRSRDHAQVVPLLAPGAAGGGDETMLEWLEELPEPCVKVESAVTSDPQGRVKLPFFGLLNPRSSEDKVLCLDWKGAAVLCDIGKGSTQPMPFIRDQVGFNPVSVSLASPDAKCEEEEDLYVMHDASKQGAKSSFRVLRKDANGGRWESLPLPPFVERYLYQPAFFIRSYTVVNGGRSICLSSRANGIGTYCFDTVEREWRHVGDWILPFEGRVEYAPELNLWVGFAPSSSSTCSYLCATSNLNTMAMDQPPKLQYVWQDIVTPQNWVVMWMHLISLGSGRFCIAKLFEVQRHTGKPRIDDWNNVVGEVLVFTGVEIVRRGGNEGLEVLRHKSISYLPRQYDIKWVL